MIRRATVATLAGVVALSAPRAAGAQSMAEADAIHLLQRATWGVRPADVRAAASLGGAAWLERQLHPSRIDDRATEERLRRFPAAFEEMTAQVVRSRRALAQRQEQRQEPRAGQGMNPRMLLVDLVGAKLARAVHTERQLEDVMTDFWYNHFNVFFGKGIDRHMVAAYEREAIRPHVFGSFRDLLGATARHPAMLFYLDNATSVAADSMRPRNRRALETPRIERVPNGRMARARPRGINENYARELLELHTLGVDGGYTQEDVVAVARAFTGWTFRRPGPRGDAEIAFEFRPALHDAGVKVVLGTTLPAGRGVEDGEEVLDMLARHPATARHVARKLVERFVSDAPDPAFVAELAAVFTRTDGDLREVTRALFASPRFYDPEVRRARVKTPFELVASALRATGAEVGPSRALVQTLRTLGHLPYNEPAPTGYPASSEAWVNSGAMVSRMNFALGLAAGRIDGVRIDPHAIPGGTRTGTAEEFVPAMLERLLPGVETAKLLRTILGELATPAPEAPAAADGAVPRPQRRAAGPASPMRDQAARALGLALGSPEFQRK